MQLYRILCSIVLTGLDCTLASLTESAIFNQRELIGFMDLALAHLAIVASEVVDDFRRFT